MAVCSLIRDALFGRKSSHAHRAARRSKLASLGGADVYLTFIPLEDEMKKDRKKDQERKPRRLSLKRETIQILQAPVLLALARGGYKPDETCPTNSHSLADSGAC
jgi:hypothetical protein